MSASYHHQDRRGGIDLSQFATSVTAIVTPIIGVLYLIWYSVLKYPLNDLFPFLVAIQSEDGRLEARQQARDTADVKVKEAKEKNDPEAEAPIERTPSASTYDHKTTTSETTLPARTLQQPLPATLAGLTSHLYSIGGLLGPFRAFWYHLLLSIPYVITRALLSRTLSDDIIIFVSQLLVAPFVAVWVRCVLSTTPKSSIWARFPPLRNIFRNTWRVHLIDGLAAAITRFANNKMMKTVSLGYRPDFTTLITESTRAETWIRLRKVLLLILVSWVLTEVPRFITSALVYRVHGSMLPQGGMTIIPVHRQFRQSRLLPQQNRQEQHLPGLNKDIEQQDDYVISVSEAWRSLTWTVWFRLGMLKLQTLALQAGLLAIGYLLFIMYLAQTMPPRDEL